MSELVIKEERKSLWYGKEEETSCGPCAGEKREALGLERKKRLVVEKREFWKGRRVISERERDREM